MSKKGNKKFKSLTPEEIAERIKEGKPVKFSIPYIPLAFRPDVDMTTLFSGKSAFDDERDEGKVD